MCEFHRGVRVWKVNGMGCVGNGLDRSDAQAIGLPKIPRFRSIFPSVRPYGEAVRLYGFNWGVVKGR